MDLYHEKITILFGLTFRWSVMVNKPVLLDPTLAPLDCAPSKQRLVNHYFKKWYFFSDHVEIKTRKFSM